MSTLLIVSVVAVVVIAVVLLVTPRLKANAEAIKKKELEAAYVDAFVKELQAQEKENEKAPLEFASTAQRDTVEQGAQQISGSPTAISTRPTDIPADRPSTTHPEPKSNGDKIRDFLKDNKTTIGLQAASVATTLAAQTAVKLAIKHVSQKTLAKVAFRAQAAVLKTASQALLKTATKVGVEALTRLGLRAGKVAAQSAMKAGVVAQRMAAKAALAGTTGPGAPFVEAAFLAFDVLSMGLDIGDAGGYGKMGTNKKYKEMRDEINRKVTEAVREAGGVWPNVVGPLDKMTSEEYMPLVAERVEHIMDPANNHPLVKAMMDQIKADADAGKLNPEDEAAIAAYDDLVDIDAVFNEAFGFVCASKGGKVLSASELTDISAGWVSDEPVCGYRDKQSCEASYSLPPGDEDVYAEWDASNNACIAASYGMRGICLANDLEYDTATGICKIDERYCKTKGAEWVDGDCKVPLGQSFAEMLFGTTIVRGLKQIFDPDQYEKCKDDETDDGYFCRKVGCPEKTEQNGGLCYPKCSDGYEGDGPVCWKCPPDEDGNPRVKRGALCYSQCPPGHESDGTNGCYKNAPDDWKGTKTITHLQHDTLRSPAKPLSSCPDDKEKRGALCYERCPPGYESDGTHGCYLGIGTAPQAVERFTQPQAAFPVLFGAKGGVVTERFDVWPGTKTLTHLQHHVKYSPAGPIDSCGPEQEKNGALCYPKCPTGMNGVGPVCWQTCPDGFTDTGVRCEKTPQIDAKPSYGRGAGTPLDSCPAGKDKEGALCYDRCRDGFVGNGPVCWQTCPPGFTNTGVRCEKITVQAKPSYGRGAGTAPDACPPGKERNGALCYDACRAGYTGNGPVCWEQCRAGYHDDGATCRKTDVGLKVTIGQRQSCRADEDMVVGLCYPKCRAGFTATTANICQKGGDVYGKNSYGRGGGSGLTCGGGKENQGGLCYDPCNAGYSGNGPMCWGTCPDGFTNDGATCRKDESFSKRSQGRGAGEPLQCAPGKEKRGALCYDVCEDGYERRDDDIEHCSTKCPDGFRNIGIGGCERPRVNVSSSLLTCAPGQEQRGGLCYDACPPGYERRDDDLEHCSLICPDGFKNIGVGGCERPRVNVDAVPTEGSYGRGVGVPAVTIRNKKRIVDYSTKKN